MQEDVSDSNSQSLVTDKRSIQRRIGSETNDIYYVRLDSLLRSLIGDSRRINRGHPFERRPDRRFIAIHLTSHKSRFS